MDYRNSFYSAWDVKPIFFFSVMAVLLILAALSYADGGEAAYAGVGLFLGLALMGSLVAAFEFLRYSFNDDSILVLNVITGREITIPYSSITQVERYDSDQKGFFQLYNLGPVRKVSIFLGKEKILCFASWSDDMEQFLLNLASRIGKSKIKECPTRYFDIRFTLIGFLFLLILGC